jgi:hypothetical protein
MNNPEQEGGKRIEPLEPGRPDVMPNPPPGSEELGEHEGERPIDDDEEMSTEEDMSDVDANNAVGGEIPAQH